MDDFMDMNHNGIPDFRDIYLDDDVTPEPEPYRWIEKEFADAHVKDFQLLGEQRINVVPYGGSECVTRIADNKIRQAKVLEVANRIDDAVLRARMSYLELEPLKEARRIEDAGKSFASHLTPYSVGRISGLTFTGHGTAALACIPEQKRSVKRND